MKSTVENENSYGPSQLGAEMLPSQSQTDSASLNRNRRKHLVQIALLITVVCSILAVVVVFRNQNKRSSDENSGINTNDGIRENKDHDFFAGKTYPNTTFLARIAGKELPKIEEIVKGKNITVNLSYPNDTLDGSMERNFINSTIDEASEEGSDTGATVHESSEGCFHSTTVDEHAGGDFAHTTENVDVSVGGVSINSTDGIDESMEVTFANEDANVKDSVEGTFEYSWRPSLNTTINENYVSPWPVNESVGITLPSTNDESQSSTESSVSTASPNNSAAVSWVPFTEVSGNSSVDINLISDDITNVTFANFGNNAIKSVGDAESSLAKNDVDAVVCPQDGIFDSTSSKRSFDMCALFVAISGIEPLKNSDSSQSKAAKWILQELGLTGGNITNVSKLIELYAMGVLWLELNTTSRSIFSTDVCLWEGVQCSAEGYVFEINLVEKSLNGSIPSEIGELSHVRKLDFSYNNLSGTIPSTMGKLERLSYLDLSSNSIEGNIPNEIYDIGHLENLYLNRNHLKGSISTGLGNLTSLVDFRVDENELTGELPSTVKTLQNLRFFIVRMNRMSGSIPESLFALKMLFYVDLSHNEFSGEIPTNLKEARKIKHIHLDHNRLTGPIPWQVGLTGRKRLMSLYLNDNELTGTVPRQLANQIAMNDLFLQNNKLSGIPNSVCGLSALVNHEVVQLEADCDICKCRTLCSWCK